MRRRDQNRYIFAPEGRGREKNHAFRKTFLSFFLLLAAGLLISNFIMTNHVRLEQVRLSVLNLPPDLEQ